MIMRLLLLMLALCVPATVRAAAPEAVTLRLEMRGDLGAPSWFAMRAPDRVVIDVPGGDTPAGSAGGRGIVRKVRLAQFDQGTARAVIHLDAPARVSDARVEAGAVVVTLTPTTPADFARLPALGRFAAKPHADPLRTVLDAALAPAAAPAGSRPVVVVDAGHGGHDVGAISAYEGRYEKDLTLGVAKAIARELEAGGRVQVKLTRSDDRFVPLHERVRFARDAGAALFLSIHGDSAPNTEARGATVYTLSDVASDRMAARAAARENRAGLVHGVELQGEDPEVAGLLYSLVQRNVMNASADFAQELRLGLGGFRGEAHRFAGFAVLRTGDTAAALLETGYVTNLDDARYLFSADGQRAIAKGVRTAVERWLSRRTPVLAQAGGSGVAGAGAPR